MRGRAKRHRSVCGCPKGSQGCGNLGLRRRTFELIQFNRALRHHIVLKSFAHCIQMGRSAVDGVARAPYTSCAATVISRRHADPFGMLAIQYP